MRTIELSPQVVSQMLARLRWLYVAGQLLVIAVVYQFLDLQIPLYAMLSVSAMAFVGCVVASFRQRHQVLASSHREIAGWLVFDLVILAMLLYLSGGATNPLATLLLVPVAFAVVVLSKPYRWGVVIIAMLLYSILMVWFRELPHFHHAKVSNFDLHVIGMWVNFIVSAIIFITFLSTLSRELRAREQERKRHDEIITAGVIAAGAAHELATPLSTASMLTEALQATVADEQAQADLALLAAQHDACKGHLKRLLAVAGGQLNQAVTPLPAAEALTELCQMWELTRPQIRLTKSFELLDGDRLVELPISLVQALMGLLNNAADASLLADSHDVEMLASEDEQHVYLHIDDFGKGLSNKQLHQVGQVAFSSKSQGGLGLVLSHASVEQLGGTLVLQGRSKQQGMRATVSIPKQALMVNA